MRGGRAVTVVRADGSGSAVLGCGAFSFDGRCLRHLDLVVRHRGEVLEGCCRFFDMVDEMRRGELGEEEEGLCRSVQARFVSRIWGTMGGGWIK
jgi:hypothetical protein